MTWLSVVNYSSDMHHLVGAAEIADMLGITRQRVNQLVRRDPTFPKPEAELIAGRVWKRTNVEAWMRKTGRVAGVRQRPGRKTAM